MPYPVTLSTVSLESGKIKVERAIRIQSFRTPATRTVRAPVRPITRNTEKFNTSAQRALVKNTQKSKFNFIVAWFISGFSNRIHGMDRNKKLQKATNT